MSEFNQQKFINSLSNIQRIRTSDILTPSNQNHLHTFSTLPSTNQTLWQLIDSGASPGTIVIATQQTSGRGQWGRNWKSTIGGLYMSVATNISISQTPQLTLSTAWGIASSLEDYGVPVKIKWPNDLILENRKLGGILTETRINKKKISTAVIGIGINWANSVPDRGINLQSYYRNQCQTEISSLEMLAAIVFHGLDSAIKQLLDLGIESILPGYTQLLINMGQEVLVENRLGKIVGVTNSGELKVKINPDSGTLNTQSQILSSEIYLKPGTISLGYGQVSKGVRE
ncbi:MAG: biotin--[acetyl-CoA-carboxylase] ligase [Okeania sp. SIO2F4]|uniref:biotin--[acetyl-CoA-carboxylase] ligase n=1 Tax=Okeania sp. SIO2F4 TaxID=2607790 RepID=UPI00142AE69E|nr:biotin--[acetyl-CoA-carboxylase] ligase [Okeania sp. SIO2F4]NES05680.1 biotin--[acetyl-CoA-carboxylase] ligase [Okeania sp. SIO2F4]